MIQVYEIAPSCSLEVNDIVQLILAKQLNINDLQISLCKKIIPACAFNVAIQKSLAQNIGYLM
jgi:predicted GNAT family acetyltransferase